MGNRNIYASKRKQFLKYNVYLKKKVIINK